MEIKDYIFYQDSDTCWYIDIPDWLGEKSELQMVSGADDMLNYMAEGNNKVRLMFSEEKIEGWDGLILKELTPEIGGGNYNLKEYRGIKLNLDMWLCGVTEYVFGRMPKTIYIKKVEY